MIEESKDEKPEIKVEEHIKVEPKIEKPRKKTDYWKIFAIIFLVLLVASIFTNGFRSFDFTGNVVEETVDEEIKDTELQLTIINDKECTECDTSDILRVFSQMFEGLDVKRIDYAQEEAQQLIKDNEIKLLPAFIFNDDVVETDQWKENTNFQSAFVQYEDKFVAVPDAVGAEHDPLKEICDNKKDDRDQDGKVDCEDDECSLKLVCNPDALVECGKKYNLTEDTVIFYYGDFCGWCAKMKPGVEELQKEGYDFHWVETSDPEQTKVIDECFSEYMQGSGVPQFLCIKNGEHKSGAFVDADKNLDIDLMKAFADECKAS